MSGFHSFFLLILFIYLDWTIRELAMYDLPALVDEVRHLTGYDKVSRSAFPLFQPFYNPPFLPQIGFIGHSQGNGTAFISLSLGIRPDLGPKLSCFVALAPAVFAGPLTTGFPFTALGRMEWRAWRRVFGECAGSLGIYSRLTRQHRPGVLDFIPIMTWAYNWAPQAFFVSSSLLSNSFPSLAYSPLM
jgi:lysosomal acid lipase/cholesteryl ester hydrolase